MLAVAPQRPRRGRPHARMARLLCAASLAAMAPVAGIAGGAGAARSAPPAPTGLRVLPGVGGLSVSWDPVASAPGLPVTYTVSSSAGGTACRTTASHCFVPVGDALARRYAVRAKVGATTGAASPPSSPVPTRVVLVVAGQSNAAGMGDARSPVDYFAAPHANAADALDQLMWLSGHNQQLELGSLDNVQEVNGTVPGMGPEIGLARQLMDDRGEEVAIVKDAIPGSYLVWPGVPDRPYWAPGAAGSEYPKLVAGVRSALSQLAARGTLGIVGGLYWFQGESDAVTPATARAYPIILGAFIKAIRRDLPQAAHLPIILAKEDISLRIAGDLEAGIISQDTATSDLRGSALVRAADDAMAARWPGVIVVDTADLPRLPDDPIHLGPAAELALGRRLAVASEAIVP